jgi:hypothetical protein
MLIVLLSIYYWVYHDVGYCGLLKWTIDGITEIGTVFTKNCWGAFVSLEDQLLKQMCTRKHGLNKKKDQLLSQSIYFFYLL